METTEIQIEKLTYSDQVLMCEKQLMDLEIDRLNVKVELADKNNLLKSIETNIIGVKASIEVLKALETHKF